jgi:hypothetical protein
MKNLCMLLFAVVLGCAAASGQTNDWPKAGPVFALHLQLRVPDEAPKSAAPAGSLGSGGAPELRTKFAPAAEISQPAWTRLNTGFETTSLSVRQRDFEVAVFNRLDRAGYFARPQRESDSAVVRWAEGTFRPEVLRIGKTEVTCSLVTAIKRKNPLCLLNPMFLNVSW